MESETASGGLENRLIGVFEEGHRGPLVFMIGGIHGNEKAGVKALEYLIKMLEVEHITNEAFRFRGRLIAFKGNLQALSILARERAAQLILLRR